MQQFKYYVYNRERFELWLIFDFEQSSFDYEKKNEFNAPYCCFHFDCTLKSGTFSFLRLVLPGHGTALLKSRKSGMGENPTVHVTLPKCTRVSLDGTLSTNRNPNSLPCPDPIHEI